MKYDSQDRREPTTPLPPRPTLDRARWALARLAGAALLACFGLPLLQAHLAAAPAGHAVATLPVTTGLAGLAIAAQPAALGIAGLAGLTAVAAAWAGRQRRRLVGQIARGLQLRVTDNVIAHLIPGLRAPLHAEVYLPAGYVFTSEQLDETAEVLSRAWGYVYRLDYHRRRDALRARRAWRRGLQALDAAHALPEDPLHARLEELRPEIPQLDVQSLQATDHDPDTGRPREFLLRYTPKFDLTVGSLADKLSLSLTSLTASAIPEGHKLAVTWEPEQDQAWLRVAETLPTRVDHPIIDDYPSFLGSDKLLLPYATADYGRILTWEVDHSSPTPHGLVAGKTGAGKTTFLRTVIPEGIRRGIPWLLIDPKHKELIEYELYPGVLGVVTEIRDIVDAICMLWDEKVERYRVGKRERLEDHEFPLLGCVYDEFPLLQFQLQRLMKQDQEVKDLDPLGMITIMFSDARGAGIRKLVGAQRADSHIFGSGLPRLSLGMRVAMQRGDRHSDEMMFDRSHVTSQLDQTVRGRGVGTLPTGDPAECQVWLTPRLDQHPRAWAKLTDEQRAYVHALLPHTPPDPQTFLPWHQWAAVLPGPSGTLDTTTDDTPAGEDQPTEESEPDRDGQRWDLGELPLARAGTLERGQRVLADVDGALVPATLRDRDDDGAGRLDLDVVFDDNTRHTLAGIDSNDLLPLLEAE